MKVNITYIISNINKALAFEWIASYLNKEKFNLSFILLNAGNSELENYLINNNFLVNRINYSGKKDILRALFLTFKLLKKNKTKIVHTHLFDANIIGLTAAKLAGIRIRIHTRHHADFHHEYYPAAVKYDKLANYLSTDIIAISNVVRNILIEKEHVNEKKIHLIHHGFLLDDFKNVIKANIEKLRQKYIPECNYPVIGVISRYTELKGIQYIIPAFKKLLDSYPNAFLVLANAGGAYKDEIKKILQSIPLKSYIEIPFESDIFALYQLFDIFIHVPISYNIEAFGQTYVEALAAGVPSIFTLSGVANEFIKNRENALVVPYKDADSIYQTIIELLNNKDLVQNLKINGQEDIFLKFNLKKMILLLEQIYEQ